MRWCEQKDVLSHIVDCYSGTDHGKRQFIWEEPNGDIVIGNTRAFTDHMSIFFAIKMSNMAWTDVHHVLRELGEIVHGYSPRVRIRGKKFCNQEPEVRVIKKKA